MALSSVKKTKLSAHGQGAARLHVSPRCYLTSLFALVAGGVGKTTMAAAVVRDSAVRHAFARIAWVSVGQTPAVMELQRTLYNHLTGATMPVEDGATAQTQHQALATACVGQRWLIVLDDVS